MSLISKVKYNQNHITWLYKWITCMLCLLRKILRKEKKYIKKNSSLSHGARLALVVHSLADGFPYFRASQSSPRYPWLIINFLRVLTFLFSFPQTALMLIPGQLRMDSSIWQWQRKLLFRCWNLSSLFSYTKISEHVVRTHPPKPKSDFGMNRNP